MISGPGCAMKFRLHQPTLSLLEGLKGIELGAAAHNPFGVDCINVAPALPSEAFFDQNQLKMCGEIAPVDLRGHAADIPVPDDSQDFVVSSHVLEHAPDLLRAFLEMDRVVRPGGYVVVIFPQPDALAGDERPLSTMADLCRAYNEKWTFETAPEGFAHRNQGGHYWKMPLVRFVELVLACRGSFCLEWRLVGSEDPDSKVGNGFWTAWRIE